ncbi:hypothetical protein MHU86_16334 [Fragilaria crotonensis]|nr:hypothetical protein MHU86_16334 [Fragilaria crotonensis]
MNGRTILIVSNLVTIAVTACVVLFALHQHQHQIHELQTRDGADQHSMASIMKVTRFLQAAPTPTPAPCCSCQTGKELPPLPSICFPSGSTVQIQGQVQPRRLEDIRIGDIVHVGSNKYEPVYSFGHYGPNSWSRDFVRLHTAAGTLTLSSDHMVWTNEAFQAAASVKPGDLLQMGDGGTVEVRGVSGGHEERGLLAPFTPSGKIVVDGFVASTFIHVPGTPTTYLSPQWLAHSFEFPHRVACHYMGACPSETYNEHGVSTWVALPLEVGQLFLKSSLRNWFLALIVMMCATFNVVETVLFQYPALAMAAVGVYSYHRHVVDGGVGRKR